MLGDNYVNMTERNIASGDPFGVYKQENEWLMWVRIAYNNIKVAMMCFIGGIFFSAGTLWLLTSNGIMLGAFQYFFFAIYDSSDLVGLSAGTFKIIPDTYFGQNTDGN